MAIRNKWLHCNDLVDENVPIILDLLAFVKRQGTSEELALSIVSDVILPPVTGQELKEWLKERNNTMNYNNIVFKRDTRNPETVFGKKKSGLQQHIVDQLRDLPPGASAVSEFETYDEAKEIRQMMNRVAHDLGWFTAHLRFYKSTVRPADNGKYELVIWHLEEGETRQIRSKKGK